MLTVPAFRNIEGVTVYRDDTSWFRFYVLAKYPRIRLNEEGDPVFLLVKYALSDEDRENDPKLPAGGGYMNFDIEFTVEPEKLENVRLELQEWVDQEWERLRNGTGDEKKLPGVADAEAPPAVDFGTPTFTEGTVRMDAPQSEVLVEARVAEGKPSLLSDNLAVFSMDLSPAGATFMEKTLLGNDGTTVTDLTPVQVRYDLSFQARLPPVRITVTADSRRIYEQVRKYMDGAGVDKCTSYRFQNSDITTETAHSSGLIKVVIDQSTNLDKELVSELTGYALETMQNMIESKFFTDEPEDAYVPDFPDGPPPEVVEKEKARRHSRRRRKENPRKYLRKNYDKSTMRLELNIEQRSVVDWTIHPQATLETFFTGRSSEDLKKFVRSISLDDPFYQHLNLTVTPHSDIGPDRPVEAVTIDVRYEGKDDNGQRQTKEKSFTFTSRESQSWNPSLIGGEREYEWRQRVKFRDREFSPYSEWQKTTASHLNIEALSGDLEIRAEAGDLDFEELIDQVQVKIAYEDPERGIVREESTIVLSSERTSGTYERTLFDLVRQPIQFRRRYKLKSGEIIEDKNWQSARSRQLLINQPFEDMLNVRLLPIGDAWDEVVQVIVNLRYRDPVHQFSVEESVTFKSSSDSRNWTVVLKDKHKRDFEYQVLASYKDGRFEEGEWIRQDGEQVVPVEVSGPPIQRIQIVGDRLDVEASPVTEVNLRHLVVDSETTLVFRERGTQEWLVETSPETAIRYEAAITYFPATGDPVDGGIISEDDSLLVLPPYRPPESGTMKVRIIQSLVDFAKTPLVMVDLTYEDEANGVRVVESIPCDGTGNPEWTFAVKDVNRKLYSYKITYFVAPDNIPREEEVIFQDRPVVVIPKLQT